MRRPKATAPGWKKLDWAMHEIRQDCYKNLRRIQDKGFAWAYLERLKASAPLESANS